MHVKGQSLWHLYSGLSYSIYHPTPQNCFMKFKAFAMNVSLVKTSCIGGYLWGITQWTVVQVTARREIISITPPLPKANKASVFNCRIGASPRWWKSHLGHEVKVCEIQEHQTVQKKLEVIKPKYSDENPHPNSISSNCWKWGFCVCMQELKGVKVRQKVAPKKAWHLPPANPNAQTLSTIMGAFEMSWN